MDKKNYLMPTIEVLDAIGAEPLLADSIKVTGLDEGETFELVEIFYNAWNEAK